MAARYSAGLRVPKATVATVCFVLFLFLSLVGLNALSDRSSDDVSLAREGSVVSQVAFVLISLVLAALVTTRSGGVRTRGGGWIAAALFWALITLSWSPIMGGGIKKYALTLMTIVVMYSSIAMLGEKRSIELLGMTLGSFVVASLIAGTISTSAIHQYTDAEPAIAGSWRGIFFHKNSAGFVAATSVLLSTFLYFRSRSKRWVVVLLSSISFLVLTQSKTSLGLLLPSAAIGLLLGRAHRQGRGRLMIGVMLGGLALLSGLLLAGFLGGASKVLDDPESFTGRTEIWSALSRMIADHPIGGIGFGSVYAEGPWAPFADYASGWVVIVTQGHNGYLDVLASTGVVGLILVIMAFILNPIRSLLRVERGRSAHVALVGAMFAFVVLHNSMESSLFDRNRPAWLVLLFGCALIGQLSQPLNFSRRS